jgi:peptide/nickel transport system substrate-binding protein
MRNFGKSDLVPPIGQLDRREFIRSASALGIAASLGSVASSVPARAQTPKRGGTLKIGLPGTAASDSLDPNIGTTTYTLGTRQQVYNELVDYDEHGRVQPSLAESWDTKPGAEVWVFKIRRGVTFHNGKELLASDVVASFNYHRGPDSKSPAKSFLSAVKDIKATDKYEVTFTLNGGNVDFPYITGEPTIAIGPEGVPFAGIGTGPFILENLEPGVRMTMKRNPNYWRTGHPYVDSVEVIGINDSNARVSALLSGAVHLINRVDPRAVTQIAAGKFQVFEIASGGQYFFPMRTDTAPFDNVDVRLALKYAIDRKSIIDRTQFGHAEMANDQPIPKFLEFFAADIPQRPYDPDQAAFHFKKSGYSGSIPLAVSDVGWPGAVDGALVLQASAAKAGIKVDVDRVGADGYFDQIWMKRPFCASYWEAKPTVDSVLTFQYQSTAVWNDTFWKRPDFDRILLAARAELDKDKRKSMYHDLQMMIYENGGALTPMFNHTIDAGSNQVKGFVQRPLYQLGGYRAPEDVWLEG